MQSDIDANETASDNADAALQGQIDGNDGDILALQQGLSSEISARQFGDAANANAIGANTANLNAEIQNREDADSDLSDYDAYLLDLISNTANTPLDVANILEGLDYFDDNGSGTVNLEAGWSLVDFGSAQIQASTSSFDAVDAQTIDADDANIQNMEVTNNLVSPAGTIGDLDATSLEVYQTSDLDGAVTMGSTLNVSGETTLGADVSVTGDVSATGNVSAADATAAGHLASFGQLTTAADTLQDNIDDEEARAMTAEGLLNDRADSLATAVAGNDTDIQTNADNLAQEILDRVADVNAEEARALAAEGLLNDRADSLAAAVAGNDTDIQTNADNLAQEILDRVADVNAEEARALAAEGLLNDRADSLAAAVAGNDTDIQTNADNLAQEILDRVADVNAEETRALAAEGLLDARADSLATAVAGNDTDIQTNADNISSNDTDIQTNADNLAQEILDRVADVNAEETRALAAEGLLDARADSLATAVAGNDTDIQTNADNISSNDTDIQTNADNLAQEILDRVADVNAEETRALAAEGLLDARADSLAAAVAGNDTDIQTNTDNLDQEILDRVADVNAEEARALAAEGLLDARADSLAAAVAGNDTDIQTNADNLAQEILDRVADVNAEEARALAAEGLLNDRADSLATAVAGNDTDIQTNATAISNEVTRATTREDSIINQMYWNQAVAGTVTLDAGVTDLNLAGVGIQASSLNASQSVTAPVGMITQITSSEASIEEMQAEDINTEDLTAIHIRGIGTGISTVDFDGTLNVDGVSTLQALNAQATTTTTLNATGAADMDAGLNVDGASTLDGTTSTATST